MPQICLIELFTERVRIGQISVVTKADPVGRIHIKGLRQGRAFTAGCGVTYMADAHGATQALHVILPKHVAHETDRLALLKIAIGKRHDARSILATML